MTFFSSSSIERDGRAEHHLVARQRRRIDDHRAAQTVLEVGDGRLDLALALLGRMIFGIFAQVAVRARDLDRLDDRRALARLRRRFNSSSSLRWPSASIGTLSALAIRQNPFLETLPGARPV